MSGCAARWSGSGGACPGAGLRHARGTIAPATGPVRGAAEIGEDARLKRAEDQSHSVSQSRQPSRSRTPNLEWVTAIPGVRRVLPPGSAAGTWPYGRGGAVPSGRPIAACPAGRRTTAPGRPPPSAVLAGGPALRDLRSARAARPARVSVPGFERQALPPAGGPVPGGKELPAEGNSFSAPQVNDISSTVGDSTKGENHEPRTQHTHTASHRFPIVPPPPRMARSRSAQRPPAAVGGPDRG